MISLPDVNVLVALAWSSHPHHNAAHKWFGRDAAAGWATCLLTQTGFMRLSMNPKIVGLALDCQSVRGLLQRIVSHSTHQFIEECPSLTAGPFDDLVSQIAGYRQLTDATLLHLARSHNLKVVTLDQSILTICPWTSNIEILIP